jgi:hypothetical protein
VVLMLTGSNGWEVWRNHNFQLKLSFCKRTRKRSGLDPPFPWTLRYFQGWYVSCISIALIWISIIGSVCTIGL